MGQKVHPVGFRLGITKYHQSQWYASKYNYSTFFSEDFFLRKIILKNFTNTTISKIEIHRKMEDDFHIIIYTLQAKSILGDDDENLVILKKYFVDELKKYRNKKNVKLNNSNEIKLSLCIIELTKPELNASIISNIIAEQLQKRILFRRIIKKSIQSAQNAEVKGIKIQISGRLNGSEIARSEWIRHGSIPLQTLNANIDYCFREIKTIYGILGIKVWVL
uniref:Small ribosomal subunit protein uS3c n=1 Tax=Dichotomosiphon tuberosus TaxID=118263 RepID=A0A386AWX3_9CHLO|nr:ribosomal protein S3 [Dichotomosiphon tuberosus]